MKNQAEKQNKIEEIRNEIRNLGPTRPGSVSLQKRARGGQYAQLSYNHKGKSYTEYVREEHIEQVQIEVANYKKLKELTAQWIALEIEVSKSRRNGE